MDEPEPTRAERRRAREDELRAGLQPLEPGERPGAVTVAAILALLLAVANVAAVLSGRDLGSQSSNATSVTIVTTAILLVAAYGLWRVRYWAVLGFEIILGLQVTVLALALLRVEKWWVALGVAVLIAGFGTLFYKLIRALGRMQVPERS